MPVQQILSQPSANSLNAAYRPILLRVQATDSNNYPVPPVVYCDIYVNGTFYRTIAKSQAIQVNTTNSEWLFDIQDLQNVFARYLAPHGGYAIQKPDSLLAVVFCRFRSSYADDNNIIQPDPVIPKQADSSSSALPGTGMQSNTFVVLPATLKHSDNQDLQQHLTFYKHGEWSNLAFPLTHRPNNYVITKADSDYFPFVYTGNRTVACLSVVLNMKDGTQQVVSNCEAAGECTITITTISVAKAPDTGDGRTYYKASFTISDVPDHLTIEVSTDSGATWVDITNNSAYNVTVADNNITYNAFTDGSAGSHEVRVTPYCDDIATGTVGIAVYTQPTCPTVTNLSLSYNALTQQMTYNFIDPTNAVQTVQLYKDGVPYGNTYSNAPNTGSWTITLSGTYHAEVTTDCSVGSAIVEVSANVVVTVNNPICATPTNVLLNFSPDGNSLRADWTVADSTYNDLVKWYDASNNNLLLMGNVSGGINFAVIGVYNFPTVQSFYATVQHQCPSPSVLAISGTVTRNNNYILTLDWTSSPGTIVVKCTRYGQPAPAPFTANVSISLTYQIGGGGSSINTNASNYIVYASTQSYIYGSNGITILSADIIEVSPASQGGFNYIF